MTMKYRALDTPCPVSDTRHDFQNYPSGCGISLCAYRRYTVSRKYRNPPVVEALCEFQFVPSQPWDMTIPGLLYEKIRNEFPLKRQQQLFDTTFTPKEGVVQQRVQMSERVQFLRSDEKAIIQLGPDLLAVNHLRPYPMWETFKPLIINNLGIYQDVCKPKGFKRIGLRYINQIEFTKEPIEITDYFKYHAPIPETLPQIHDTFEVKVDIPYQEGRDHLLLRFATLTPGKPEIISLLLDIDYVMTTPEGVPLEQANDWIENAHFVIETAFEACITDRSRTLFGIEE